jgi:hypothetical protein
MFKLWNPMVDKKAVFIYKCNKVYFVVQPETSSNMSHDHTRYKIYV